MWSLSSMRSGRYGTDDSATQELICSDDFDPNQRFSISSRVTYCGFGVEQVMATVQSHRRVKISELGWSFSATLVVLFILCMLGALFLPLRLAHGWVNLLSDAPIHSSRVWVEGLIWSVVLGWVVAVIFGTIYNWIVARRVFQEIS